MKRGDTSTLIIDVVPERYPYSDDGCEVSPYCLRCPLPQCKYDDPFWFQRQKRKERDKEVIAALQQKGMSVPEVAAHFALSPRTIFRILRRDGDSDHSTAR